MLFLLLKVNDAFDLLDESDGDPSGLGRSCATITGGLGGGIGSIAGSFYFSTLFIFGSHVFQFLFCKNPTSNKICFLSSNF